MCRYSMDTLDRKMTHAVQGRRCYPCTQNIVQFGLSMILEVHHFITSTLDLSRWKQKIKAWIKRGLHSWHLVGTVHVFKEMVFCKVLYEVNCQILGNTTKAVFFIYVVFVCVHMHRRTFVCYSTCVEKGQRTTFRGQYAPSTMQVWCTEPQGLNPG